MKRPVAFATALAALLGSAPALARWDYVRYGKDFVVEGAGKIPSEELRRSAVQSFRKNKGEMWVDTCELAHMELRDPINPEVGTVEDEFNDYYVTIRLDNGEEREWPVYSVLGRTKIVDFDQSSVKEMLGWIVGARELEIMIPVRRGEDVKLALDMTGAKLQINKVCPL